MAKITKSKLQGWLDMLVFVPLLFGALLTLVRMAVAQVGLACPLPAWVGVALALFAAIVRILQVAIPAIVAAVTLQSRKPHGLTWPSILGAAALAVMSIGGSAVPAEGASSAALPQCIGATCPADIIEVHQPADVLPLSPAQAPLGMFLGHPRPTGAQDPVAAPLTLASGFLLLPFAGLRRRFRLPRLVMLGFACVALLAVACMKLPAQVAKDQESVSDLYRGYVQADPLMKPGEKADRLVSADKAAYIGTSGYASPAYQMAAHDVGCAVDWYIDHDPTKTPSWTAAIHATTKAIRDALGLSACRAGGDR